MSQVKIPYAEAGQAAFEQLDDYTAADFLISGSAPALSPGYPFAVKANEVLAQHTVVGLDATGKLVKATYNVTPANAIKPIGVLTQAVTGNADGTTTVPVWWSGCFNPDALVWDASFDTMAKKLVAFQGSPTPTTIVIRERG